MQPDVVASGRDGDSSTRRVIPFEEPAIVFKLWRDSHAERGVSSFMARRGSDPQPGPSTHVALLRGINVGGKHSLPMVDLARMFEDAGCTRVRTYIQSGNVVFAASAALARRA